MSESPAIVAGRYRVLGPIGEGGLGVVYRVEDQVDHEIRALKVLPRSSGQANLRAEFLALARLKHDNIVQVFDYGVTERGEDFFTMELVEGKDLRSAAPSLTDPAFFRLIGGMLRALAFIHARGMVHADIKPSNVLVDLKKLAVDPARAAKLLDFGLAAKLTDPTSAAARGTVPYAAPEVYAGRLDARSDLYAFGVLLYELVTGQRPFPGKEIADVIRRQRRSACDDPRLIRRDTPAGLAELILALTDPEPGARLQTADEVLARINEIGGTDFAVAEEPPHIDLTGALVGRERDLGDLQALWETAQKGSGSVALIIGEEGIGKTRLLGELKLRVQLQGGKFYSASVARSSAPYSGIAALVRAVLVDFGAKHAAKVEARSVTLAPLLGAKRQATEASDSRFGFAEAVAGLLIDLSQVEPLAIALDDVAAAERGTRELLGYLARAVPSGRILLALAAREDQENDGPVAQLQAALANTQRARRMDIPPLDRGSVKALVAGIFGESIAENLAAPLHRSSGGNPSFLARTLSLLVEQGTIGRRRGEWTLNDKHPSIPLAGDAVAAALTRAAGLSESCQRALKAAAVLGETFDLATLVEILGEPDDVVSDALGAATRARLLEAEKDGGAFAFVHSGVHKAIYRDTDGETRRRLHVAAAAALEKNVLQGTGVPPSSLAEHYLAVEDWDKGTKAALAAADEHATACDYHGALAWYERARPHVAKGTPRSALVAERAGDMRAAIGDTAAACDDYLGAHADFARDVAAHVRIAVKLAELQRRRGQGDEAVSVLMKALGYARAAHIGEDEATCHYALARVFMYRGEYPTAMEHASVGLALTRLIGNRDLTTLLIKTRADLEIFRGDTKAAVQQIEAIANTNGVSEHVFADLHHTRGRVNIHAGNYLRAIESLEKAIATYQRLGRVQEESKSLNNLGAACYFQGKWDRARTSWERFQQLCERMDDTQELVSSLNNLGTLYRDRGELTEALAVLERARLLAEKSGRTHIVGMVLGNRGDVLFRQGDATSARDCYERCLSIFESIGAKEDLIETKKRLCELDIAMGRIDGALDKAIDAAREAQEAGTRLEEGILHRVAATALRLQGDFDSATWFIDKAREILGAMGARYEGARVEVEAAEIAAAKGQLSQGETHLAHAIETFAELGARWDLARVRDRKRELSAPAAIATGERLSRGGLEVLLDIARASGRMELEKLLEIVLDRILEVTRFERGFILLLDERGLPNERMRRTRENRRGFDYFDSNFSGSIVRRVAQTGEPISVTDIADDEALRDSKSVLALGLRSAMCAPMRLKGRVMGIVYVDSQHLAEDDQASDIALLEALASQAAIAIENGRLVAEEQRKTELMGILAHEIRNPLSGILAHSDPTPDEKTQIPAGTMTLLDRIHRDAQRLKRLVDNILELARVEAGKVDMPMASVVLGELVSDLKEAYDPMAGKKGVKIVVATEASLPKARGSADRLFQVLSNLLGNALKFTPSGGQITLSVRRDLVVTASPDDQTTRAPKSEKGELDTWLPLEAGADKPKAFLRVDVVDTGPGIPPERRDHLFEKFAQGEEGKRTAHGVGLGLFISREIVRRHGGTIWVESEVGKGSCFSFRIPVGE